MTCEINILCSGCGVKVGACTSGDAYERMKYREIYCAKCTIERCEAGIQC